MTSIERSGGALTQTVVDCGAESPVIGQSPFMGRPNTCSMVQAGSEDFSRG